MKTYKKREEEKKQRRDAIMAKYPPQNPRTNVSTVVTRKELPKATPLGLAKPNSGEIRENAILLTETGKMYEKVRAQLGTTKPAHDREFAIKAATGWKSYQTDEANRAARLKDPGYQKWRTISVGGVSYANGKRSRIG